MKNLKTITLLIVLGLAFFVPVHSFNPFDPLIDWAESKVSCPSNWDRANPSVTCYQKFSFKAGTGVYQVGKSQYTQVGNKKYNVWQGVKGYRVKTIHRKETNLFSKNAYSTLSTTETPVASYTPVVVPSSKSKELVGWVARIYHRAQSGGGDFMGRMHKPVILVQGFDPNYKVLNLETGTRKTFNFDDFERSFGASYIQSLLDQNYSVVTILLEDPTKSIKSNAHAALDAIKWVQAQAVGQDLTLVGPSMGGLVVRQALIYAAEQGTPIFPKTFVAYDSPNWGAIIPASVQALINYRGNTDSWMSNPDDRQRWANLSSNAAKEMLLYRVNSTNTSIQHFFADNNDKAINSPSSNFLRGLNSSANWAKLKTLKSQNGTPMQLLSLADGSPATEQGLPESNEYAFYNTWTLYLKMRTATPKTESLILTVNAGDDWQRRYHFTEPWLLENMPGGLRDSYTSIFAGLHEDYRNLGGWKLGESPFLDDGTINWNRTKKEWVVKVDYKKLEKHKGHAFVPTISALGLRVNRLRDFNNKSTWYLPATTLVLNSSQSWFDNAYLSSTNWLHVSPTDEINIDSPNHFRLLTLITKGSL